MPAEVVLGSLYAAVKTLLVASAPLTALLGKKPLDPSAPGIYDEGAVPQAVTAAPGWLPYLTVGVGTQIPENRIGPVGSARFGHNCTFQVKAVGQIAEAAGLAILSEVAKVLPDNKELTLAGYQSAYVDEFTVQPTIHEIVNGVTTRSWPAIVRVQAHD